MSAWGQVSREPRFVPVLSIPFLVKLVRCHRIVRSPLRPTRRCPKGTYCEAGASEPSFCPAGQTLPGEGAISVSDCKVCPPGRYCGPTGEEFPCDAGFICTGGASAPRLLKTSDKGYICPVGHYCLSGSISEIECPTGSLADAEGHISCEPCYKGYYCNSTGIEKIQKFLCVMPHATCVTETDLLG